MSRAARSRGLLTAFLMVFFTLLATAVLACLNLQRLYEHDRLVDQTRETISELRLLLVAIADAESGASAIGSDGPAREQTTGPTLKRIEQLTASNRWQQATLAELRELLEQPVTALSNSVDTLYTEGSSASEAE